MLYNKAELPNVHSLVYQQIVQTKIEQLQHNIFATASSLQLNNKK